MSLRSRAAAPIAAALLAGGFVAASALGSEEQAAAPCNTGAVGTQVVGTITNLVHPKVYVNGSYVGSAPRTLKLRNYICTDTAGQDQFALSRNKKQTACNMYPKSRLQVYPAGTPAAIIRFVAGAGSTYCSTSGGVAAWLSLTNTRLYTTDPVFGVTTDEKEQTVVKVTYGFFAVYPPDHAQPFMLGPLQQVVVSPSAVSGPTAAVITPADSTGIASLGSALPRPDYSPPSAGGSKVLARIFSRKAIVVGFNAAKAPAPMQSFVKRYFGLLARRWGIRYVPSSNDTRAALTAGKLDVVVTPSRGSGPVTTIPFASVDTAPWDLETQSEPDLVTAVQGYLVTTLESSDYAATYRASFGSVPTSYERFRPLIFPSLPKP